MKNAKIGTNVGWILLLVFVGLTIWFRGLTQVLAVAGVIIVSILLLSWKDSFKRKRKN